MKEKITAENIDETKAKKLKLAQLKVTQLADQNLFERLEQAESESRETATASIDTWDLHRLKKLAKPTIERYLQELSKLEASVELDEDETITGVETEETVFGEVWDPSEIPEDGDEFYH